MADSAARTRQAVWTALTVREVTQAELARRVGITPKHVNQTLHGYAGLGLDLADRMLAALDCELVVGLHVWPEEAS
jgi:transcriptional regulator with XRE-family HTH domain